jgi:hypothetical protein
VVGVQEQHDQARARGLSHGERLADRVRLDPRVLRAHGLDDNAFELLDFLRSPALEDLEVRLRQVGDRRFVLRRVGVDPDVIGLGAEGRRLLRRWRLREDNGEGDGAERDG